MSEIAELESRRTSRRDATDVEKIAGRLLRERRSAVMSLEEAARRCGLSWQQIQKYEKGENRIALGRLAQLANAIGFDAAELLAEAIKTARES